VRSTSDSGSDTAGYRGYRILSCVRDRTARILRGCRAALVIVLFLTGYRAVNGAAGTIVLMASDEFL